MLQNLGDLFTKSLQEAVLGRDPGKHTHTNILMDNPPAPTDDYYYNICNKHPEDIHQNLCLWPLIRCCDL